MKPCNFFLSERNNIFATKTLNGAKLLEFSPGLCSSLTNFKMNGLEMEREFITDACQEMSEFRVRILTVRCAVASLTKNSS